MRMVGVEEELLLVDTAAPRAKPIAEEVVAEARNDEVTDAGDSGQFDHEFKREQVEIASEPCVTLGELGSQLRRLRAGMVGAAARWGAQVAALATNPLRGRPTTTDDSRYEEMSRQFGMVARLQLTCAEHVHVAVASKEEGVAVLDRIRPWLAILTALSANSPFWMGEDTGYASYRTVLWGQWPTAGPCAAFGDVRGYERAVGDLLTSGTTLDRGMIYFDARLSATYPTVEIRVADVCQYVDDAVAVAALCRALVETAARQWHAGRPAPDAGVSLLRAAAWRAARSGLAGDLVDVEAARPVPAWTLIGRLVDHVQPALQLFGDDDAVTSALSRIRERGNGASLQRAALARRDALSDVLADAVQRTGCS
jgi:carboxylate-amine ligase